MYEIIYMKAQYEPWWQFDGWEKEIVLRRSFDTKSEAAAYAEELKQNFAEKYPHHAAKGGAFIAYWTEEEAEFCEACDDDLQTYHGLIWMVDGKPGQYF